MPTPCMTLTTRDHTMLRGAYEAIYQGTPVIVSDWALLRESFPEGAAHVENTAKAIVRGIQRRAVPPGRLSCGGGAAARVEARALGQHAGGDSRAAGRAPGVGVLKRPVLVTVSGMVGSGKSTVLRHLLRVLAGEGVAAAEWRFQQLPCFTLRPATRQGAGCGRHRRGTASRTRPRISSQGADGGPDGWVIWPAWRRSRCTAACRGDRSA